MRVSQAGRAGGSFSHLGDEVATTCIIIYLVYTCRHWNEGKTPLSLELSSNE
jgi:hypothetical protein